MPSKSDRTVGLISFAALHEPVTTKATTAVNFYCMVDLLDAQG